MHVDGVKIGQSPLFFSLLSHGDMARLITIKKQGYVSVEKSYQPEGKDLRIELNLNRTPSTAFKVWSSDARE